MMNLLKIVIGLGLVVGTVNLMAKVSLPIKDSKPVEIISMQKNINDFVEEAAVRQFALTQAVVSKYEDGKLVEVCSLSPSRHSELVPKSLRPSIVENNVDTTLRACTGKDLNDLGLADAETIDFFNKTDQAPRLASLLKGAVAVGICYFAALSARHLVNGNMEEAIAPGAGAVGANVLLVALEKYLSSYSGVINRPAAAIAPACAIGGAVITYSYNKLTE